MPSRYPPPGHTKMTINVPLDLRRRLKVAAAQHEMTVQALIVVAVERQLARMESAARSTAGVD